MSDTVDLTSVEQLPRTALTHGALYRLEVASATKPTVLLVHGAGHGAWCYGTWMQLLAAKGYASAALDVRGHGSCRTDAAGAPALSPLTGIRDYADDVIEATRQLPPRVILAGHSLGGLMVAVAAMELDLAGLALIAPSPPGNLPGAAALSGMSEAKLANIPPRAEVLARFLGGRDPGAAMLDAYCAKLCPESPRAYNERYRLSVPVDPTRVKARVVVIEAGRDDPARHPPGQDAAIARFFGGEHVLLANAAHCLMVGLDAAPSFDRFVAWIERQT